MNYINVLSQVLRTTKMSKMLLIFDVKNVYNFKYLQLMFEN